MTNSGNWIWLFLVCLLLFFLAIGSLINYSVNKGLERRRRLIKVAKVNVCVLGFLFSLLVTYDLLDMGDFTSLAVVDAAIAFGIGYVWHLAYGEWCDRRPNSFIRRSRGSRYNQTSPRVPPV